MRIDADQRWHPERRARELGETLSRNRFDGSMLFGPADPRVFENAAESGIVRGIVVRAELAESALERFGRETLLRGIECEPTERNCRKVAEFGLTLESEYGSVLLDAARRFPEVRFVARLRPDLAVTEIRENIWIKCVPETGAETIAESARRLRPFLAPLLDQLRPERLIFGSGWPECLPGRTWKEQLAVFTQAIGARPVAWREQMLGGAAAKAYLLTDTSLK